MWMIESETTYVTRQHKRHFEVNIGREGVVRIGDRMNPYFALEVDVRRNKSNQRVVIAKLGRSFNPVERIFEGIHASLLVRVPEVACDRELGGELLVFGDVCRRPIMGEQPIDIFVSKLVEGECCDSGGGNSGHVGCSVCLAVLYAISEW